MCNPAGGKAADWCLQAVHGRGAAVLYTQPRCHSGVIAKERRFRHVMAQNIQYLFSVAEKMPCQALQQKHSESRAEMMRRGKSARRSVPVRAYALISGLVLLQDGFYCVEFLIIFKLQENCMGKHNRLKIKNSKPSLQNLWLWKKG